MNSLETSIFSVNEDDLITEKGLNLEVIENLSNAFLRNRRRKMVKLQNYFENKTEILKKQKSEGVNNQINVNIAQKIVQDENGLMLGKDVEFYTSNEDLKIELDKYTKDLHFRDLNRTTSELASIFGISYELIYYDAEGEIKAKTQDPLNTFIILSNDFDEKVLATVRFSESINYLNKTRSISKVYVHLANTVFAINATSNATNTNVYNTLSLDKKNVVIDEEAVNTSKIIYFKNNNHEKGSYELMLSLIDEFEKSLSMDADDFEKYAKSIMHMAGLDGINVLEGETETQAVTRMIASRLLQTDAGTTIKYITKASQISEGKTLREEILHVIAYIYSLPFLDDKIGANTSGLSIKFRLQALENRIAGKESEFQRGIEKRIKLLINYINQKEGTDFDYRDVDIKFNRNIPEDLVSAGQWALNLNNIGVPLEEIVRTLPVSNKETIIKKLNEQGKEVLEQAEEVEEKEPENIEQKEDENV